VEVRIKKAWLRLSDRLDIFSKEETSRRKNEYDKTERRLFIGGFVNGNSLFLIGPKGFFMNKRKMGNSVNMHICCS